MDKSFLKLSEILKDFMKRSEIGLLVDSVEYSSADTFRCKHQYNWDFPVYNVILANEDMNVHFTLTLPVFDDFHDDVTVWIDDRKYKYKDSFIDKAEYEDQINEKIEKIDEKKEELEKLLEKIKK